MVKTSCHVTQHQTRYLGEQAGECQTELDEMLEVYEKEDAIRGRVDGVLQAKLKVILAQITENKNCRQKIQSAIATCQEIAKLSPGMKASVVIRKKIEQMKKEMKGELQNVKNLLDLFVPAQVKVYKFTHFSRYLFTLSIF